MSSFLGPLDTHFTSQERAAFEESLRGYGQRCIRPRPRLGDENLPFEVNSVPWSTQGRFLVDSSIRPGAFVSFAAGDYAVQDAASLLPLTLMQVRPGDAVVDCCAAPGGKSAAILEQLDGTGVLLSNEVIASRVETLQLTLGRTGYSNYMIAQQSVERLTDTLGATFDRVLVDAPCSGQSLVGRDKQSMSAFSERQIAHSAARQRTILQSAINLVKPGGRLIYSTCTFAFEENEAIIGWLRELLPGWSPVVLPELEPWQTPGYAGCYRLWPHRDHCAGGFAAALDRPSDDIDVVSGARSRPSRPWQSLDFAAQLNEWGTLGEHRSTDRAYTHDLFYRQRQSISWFSPLIPEPWRELAWSGIHIATQFGEHWQPAWPLATVDPALNTSHESLSFVPHSLVELTDRAAIDYHTGTSIHLTAPTSLPIVHPWQVATWRSRRLGWVKHTNHQLKNHLPKPLRHPTLFPG